MKLLGCHITNFGCFHDYDLTFDEGLNIILQANGWGKSTLAAFVKAMLYGFSRKRVRNVSENERLRFTPWQGGVYGGSLDFEMQGRELRVMRTFGATATKDTLKVVDIATGRSVLSEIEGDVGEWLFGLDANAFQKSVFVVQNGFGFDGSMAGLRNRMNALVNEADDVAGFDKAQARLDERRKYYKRTGNRGVIAEISRDVAKLVDTSAQDEMRIATLRQLREQMGAYDTAIAELNEQIVQEQKGMEQRQAREQERAALQKVSQQLEERRRSAQEAYDKALAEFDGHIPGTDEIEQAKRLLAESVRAEGTAAEIRKAAADIETRRHGLLEPYSQGLPTREDLSQVRGQLSKLANLDEELAKGNEATSGEGAAVGLVLDPQAVSRAQDVTKGYKRASAALKDCREARARADELNGDWDRLRQQVVTLQAEVAELNAALPDQASEVVESLRADARTLRAADLEREQALRQVDELDAQLRDARSDIEDLPKEIPDEEAAARLDAAATCVHDAVATANEARRVSNAADGRVDAARLTLDDAQRSLDEHRAATAQTTSKPPVTLIACIAGGVAAFVAGVVLGPAGGASFMLYGLGAVLVVLGLVLGRKGPSKEDGEADQALAEALSAAEQAHAAAKEQARESAQLAAESARAAEEARTALVDLAQEVFPGETFDEATIEAQVPVLKQRLTSRYEQRLRVDSLERSSEEAQQQLAAIERRIDEVLDTYGLQDLDDDLSRVADQLDMRERELSSRIALVEDRARRLGEAYQEFAAASYAPEGWKQEDAAAAAVESMRPARVERVEERARRSQSEVDGYLSKLCESLAAFGLEGVTADHMDVGVERLGTALAAYRDRQSKQEAVQKERAARESERASLFATVDRWAKKQGLADATGLTEAWFASVEEAIASYERMGWELRKAEGHLRTAESSCTELRRQLGDACERLGVPRGTNRVEVFDELLTSVQRADGLRQTMELANDEQRAWRQQHQDALNVVERLASAEGESPSDRLGMLTGQRDEFLRERARCEEQQNSTMESLERLPAVQQELALLSKKKQLATANLFTIQKTAEYLQQARDGLDGRYLGDLGDRFGDYANAWLNSEQVDAVVDGEFGVSLYENGSAHDVVGYSTGYQDLLDVCFRMALVDTIFQAEPPFLVMDDPFANLDEEKLARALQLLESLARKYQIIYFTCHPSRIEAGDVANIQMTFTLPQQRARRELPRARAKREAQERAEAQAKLVASYEVVPVIPGKASIKPASRRRTISNNLFSLAFEVDDTVGIRNNSFEVHFIDGQGRVLCDHQTVEVIDGHVVPEKVRFSLSTRDDSGSTYDLIVHEDGREPAQLAARIPFAAEVSFAADDFGF